MLDALLEDPPAPVVALQARWAVWLAARSGPWAVHMMRMVLVRRVGRPTTRPQIEAQWFVSGRRYYIMCGSGNFLSCVAFVGDKC